MAIKYSAYNQHGNKQLFYVQAGAFIPQSLQVIELNAHPEGVLIEIRRLSFHHLYGHDAKRPDVYFGPIRLPGHNLRGHPVGRAHHGAALALLGGDLGAEAEVSCGERRSRCLLVQNIKE